MKALLIGIDTLRADHMGCYGYPRDTCPHMDALAEEGTVFLNNSSAYSFTLPSFTSMITGFHPLNHGVVMNPHTHPDVNAMMLSDTVPTVAELFWDHGHTTCAVDNLFSFQSHPKWFVRGYEYHLNPTGTSLPRHGQVRADTVNRFALPWLREHAGDDFFLFLHYWDPHGPYGAPDPAFRDLYSPKKLRDLPVTTAPSGEPYVMGAGPVARLGDFERQEVDHYDGEITYLDDRLARLFDLLRELGIYDEMAIVIAADHGDIMVEREAYWTHRGVWHPTIHTPLIIKPPASSASSVVKRSAALVSNVDIVPTLAEMAGIPLPRPVDGHSLLPVMRDGAAEVREGTLSEGTYPMHGIPVRALRTHYYTVVKYYPEFVPARGTPGGVNLRGEPWWPESLVELYDNRADPAETRNLADEEPETAAAMVDQLDETVASLRQEPDAPDAYRVLMDHWHLSGAIF